MRLPEIIIAIAIIYFTLDAVINKFYYDLSYKNYVSTLNTSACERDDVKIVLEDWYDPYCFWKENNTLFFDPHRNFTRPKPVFPSLIAKIGGLYEP